MDSLQDDAARVEALGVLSRFRVDFHGCLTARGDELSELADALLCTEGPVKTLVGLSLAPEHRRGHGALYDGVNRGRIDFARRRRTLTGLPLPRAADGRLMLAVDVSNWLRPGAATSPDRLFCHVYARGKGQAQMIPGWPYSVVAALEPGRTSWTAVLDAVRLGPDDDETDVTAAQVRDVVGRLIAAGQHRDGDPDVLVVFDAGYDVTRLAFLLADLPVELLGRLRSDRVLFSPAPPRAPGAAGRPSRHGPELKLADPATWPDPPVTTVPETTRYGPADGDRLWQAFLRRFDLEHTFRLFKQVLGWTAPKIRDPAAGDRWTWIIIACHAQLRLARHLAGDLRRPWEKPAPPGRLTPARVRRGFRNIRAKTASPAGAPKPGKPGPGRPPGSKNRRPATRHDVGKNPKTDMPNRDVKKQKG